jgi:peptide/nickel transport system ATP-binding protein
MKPLAQPSAASTGTSPGTSPGQPVIDARDIRIWYGTPKGPVRAVDGVSFSIQPGEILGLVGESGSGKSTIGRGLLGLLPAGSVMDGELEFNGEDLLALSEKARFKHRGRDLAMIFQEPLTRLNPLMRVSEHFSETLRTHFPKISNSEIQDRSLEVLKVIGIPPSRWDAFPHEFSGGMRQRIMIALALVLRPAFVVADEPTTALDVLVEAQIIKILHDLREHFATSLLLITHNLGIIAEACDRVAVMYAGKIVEIGDARTVFSDPRHPYTRELLRSTITLTTDGLHSIPGAPPDLINPPSGCHFHPRCPDAMQYCSLTEPETVNVDGGEPRPGSTDAACWLNQLKEVPVDLRAPLPRGEIAVAEEA